MKHEIELDKSRLTSVIAENIKKVLFESDGHEIFENKPYDELIKDEMHRLAALSEIVPQCYQAEIYQMSVGLQSIWNEIQNNMNFRP